MTEKDKRRTYEPPRARDLSAFSVSGDVGPLGECIAGPTPYYNCVNGPSFAGPCNIGNNPDTSECATGSFHEYPACKAGGYAVTVCLSGSGQQW